MAEATNFPKIHNSDLVRILRNISMMLVCLFMISCQADENEQNPNIVIILADDMGHGDVGILNSESRIPTPNLDRIASEGMVFTDAHSGGSYCVPSRYSLLTGRYMWRTRLGSGGNLSNYAGTLIEPGRLTIAEMLKKAGYYTGMVGKWHQGIDWILFNEAARDSIRDDPNYQNYQNIDFSSPVLKGVNDYGFDYSYAKGGSAEMNPCAYIENNRVTSIPEYTTEDMKKKYGYWYGRDDNHIAENFTLEGLVPTFSDKACEFIESACKSKPGKPFFLYYALTAPHNPIVPNKEFAGKGNAGAYGDFIFELDHHVGKILNKLKELNIDKNTIVIFSSDNGPIDITRNPERWIKGDRNIYGHISNAPFQGWKGSLLEGGHRVPFFIRWPEQINAGEKCSTTIIFNDILPTLAEMLDLDLDDNSSEDGKSFFKAIIGKEKPQSFHEAIVYNTSIRRSKAAFAIRKGNYKLFVEGPQTNFDMLNDSIPV
ncbi:MAG: arylsulfatase, partial [Bacteroidales bacterium]|nr:arylsulfatase [Bacteroidales bacterium]